MSNIKAFIVSWWQSYADKHPKLTKLIIQFVKFYLISLLVTLLQYLMLTFMPSFIAAVTNWEEYDCYLIPIFQSGKYIFNYSIADGGMAYFAGYGATLFVAQCVNFPLQRNVTFKSKGKISYQIMWYVIAFILIFMVCSGLQTFYQPLLKKYIGEPALYNILITVINGGVQMFIYFPIYKIIFPEGEINK
ncbi:MAG: hypothetical protein K0R92_1312 [Lachnospiraceae bacterium]|jgi:hypothetical protein|nr:hypothetical protein [Lachnospiraceae bacterium]